MTARRMQTHGLLDVRGPVYSLPPPPSHCLTFGQMAMCGLYLVKRQTNKCFNVSFIDDESINQDVGKTAT